MADAGTRIRLCGRLEVEIEGERLEGALPGKQGKLLFAYLVLHRDRPVRRDELIDALWSENGAAVGAGAGSRGGRQSSDAMLRPPLSRLRKVLGEGRIAGRGELSLALPPDAWVDWEAAHESLAAARAAGERGDWRTAVRAAGETLSIADGGLLPGLEGEWLEERRRELFELRVEALEAIARAGGALGGADLAPAERAARAAIKEAPFRESSYAALMQILHAGGNVAEALAVYEELRTTLRDELGTSPTPALIALHEGLLTAGDEPAPPQAPAPAPLKAAPRREGEIVERETELSALDEQLAKAAAGEGGVLLIEGPAGIGKSRLLAEARERAPAAGMRSLVARASELEREFPFGVVRQLFEAALADPATREAALAGAAAPAATVFDLASPEPAAQTDASFATLHGLFWLALNLSAAGPLLLSVDDLHWCDRPSLRFLAYLAQRLDGVPILLGCTLRTGEPGADTALLGELEASPTTVAIHPRPLTGGAVRELVQERLGDAAAEAFSAACHRATVGNPLLLRQLLTALEADGVEPTVENAETVRQIGPAAVARSVLLRLSRLGDDARAVARAVAVLGESAALPTIGALAGLDEEGVARVTGSLARSEILRPDPPPGFVHPLVRDAVYHDLPLGERELHHERAARLLAEAGAPVEQVASHILAMPRRGDVWATEQLLKAGRYAMAKGAPESAAAMFARALEEPPPVDRRPTVLFELGVAERLTNGPAGAAHLEEAYAAVDDPLERARVAQVLALTHMFAGAPERTYELAREAAAALPADEQDVRLRFESIQASAIMWGAGDWAELRSLERYREPAAEAEATVGRRMVESVAAFHWTYTGGTAQEVAELSLRVLEGDLLLTAEHGLAAIPAINALSTAEHPEAAGYWERATAEAFRRGSLVSMATINSYRGAYYFYRGELIEAEDILATALEQITQWGFGAAATTQTHAFMANVLTALGDFDAAWRHIDAAPKAGGWSDMDRWLLITTTDLLLMQGRWQEALDTAEECGRRFPFITQVSISPWETMKAIALGQLGRREEALELALAVLERGRRWGSPTAIGPVMRVIAALDRANERDWLTQAVEVMQGSLNRHQHARARFEYGAMLRRSGEVRAAVPELSVALELAEASGARPLLVRVRDELAACGVDVPSERASGVHALTPTERRAAELAASGAGDVEIAQALFVTPSTVEARLAGAVRKLGARSREELGELLAAAA